MAIGALLASCSTDDGAAPADDPNTCTVTDQNDFSTRRFVYELAAPGRPSTTTWYDDDNVLSARWTFAYDDLGRVIEEELDCCSGTYGGPDGIVDVQTRYEHTPTSAIVTIIDDPAGPTEHTIDEAEHITHTAFGGPAGTVDYVLNDDGSLARAETNATDIDLGPFTRIDQWRYEAGRVVERATSDTRSDGVFGSIDFAYESQPGRLVVTWGTSADTDRQVYSYDASGRLVRVELDQRADGELERVTEFHYDGAAVTVTWMNVTYQTQSVVSYSSACRYQPAAPSLPSSGMRPGTVWTPHLAPILDPFTY
jgi:hypothetical protein